MLTTKQAQTMEIKEKKQKNIGIWGLGKVGTSAIQYFFNQGYQVKLLEKRIITDKEKKWLKKRKVHIYHHQEINAFLDQNERILASPGVDLSLYPQYQHKWLTELDIIGQNCTCPIVGITGTVGKTTITTLLSQMLQKANLNVWTGGNIGTPMLKMLTCMNPIDLAVLEASSFQLEHCKTFAPNLAIWTNFYPNHLDRHKTIQDYFAAKKKIFDFQDIKQHALLPLSLIDLLQPTKKINSNFSFFCNQQPLSHTLKKLRPQDQLFYLKNKNILHYCDGATEAIQNLTTLKHNTFEENLLILFSALYILNRTKELSEANLQNVKNIPCSTLEHRLEKVATINGVTFYNDSKSTTPASTLAAVNKLCNQPIILLLGGLSKGVNRDGLIEQVKNKVKKIYCFGKEAAILAILCQAYAISHKQCTNLDEATLASYAIASDGDQILLSPSGSSFDLFASYIERGNYFKQLIQNRIQDLPIQAAKKEVVPSK